MSLKEKALILDKAGIDRALTRIAHEILEKNKGSSGAASTWRSGLRQGSGR